MPRITILIILLLFVFAIGLTGCSLESPDKTGAKMSIDKLVAKGDDWRQYARNHDFQLSDTPSNELYSYGTYPKINDITLTLPLAAEFARQHLGEQVEKDILDFLHLSRGEPANDYEDINNAINNFLLRNATYARFADNPARILNPQEPVNLLLLPDLEALSSTGQNNAVNYIFQRDDIIMEPICYDALVFFTHPDNPVANLTMKQVTEIYTGKIKNWRELGGEDKKIKAYQREPDSYAQILLAQKIETPSEELIDNSAFEISLLKYKAFTVPEYDNTRNSIGFTMNIYKEKLYGNKDLKILKVDGVYPNEENISQGTYPLRVPYYGIIYKHDEQGEPKEFLNWILSTEGQNSVKQAGYFQL